MVRIRELSSDGSLGEVPPGDRRIWDAMCQDVAPVVCHPGRVVFIGIRGNDTFLNQDDVRGWLGFPGLQEIIFLEKPETLMLQVRRLGNEPDALETLVRERLVREGIKQEDIEVWSALHFEFDDSAPIAGALNALIQLGPRSGIFHSALEEARLIGPGDSFRWERKVSSVTSLAEAYQSAYLEGFWAALRRNYRMEELRPRTPTESRELRDPLSTEVQRKPSAAAPRMNEGNKAPLTFLAGMPSAFDALSNPDALCLEVAQSASLYDRSVGTLIFRSQTSSVKTLEVFSPLPLNQRALGDSPAGAGRLFMMGPWDSRNSLVERRIQSWTQTEGKEAVEHGELVDGEQDLILFYTRLLGREPGWAVRMEDIKHLIAGNAVRSISRRAWFFWSAQSPELLQKSARAADLSLLFLGEKTQSGKCEFLKPTGEVMDGIKISLLKAEPGDVVDVKWEYPEIKAPTYGFDKAAVYPDQYLLKVSTQNTREKGWSLRARTFQSGERIRSVSIRRMETSPLKYFRWTDGISEWAESIGTKEGWSDVDPRSAGMSAADAALRGLLAAGGEFRGGHSALWLSQPWQDQVPDPSALDEQARAWGAYILALEGASHYLRHFDFGTSFIDGAGLGFPRMKQEIFVKLRNAISPKMNPVVPGFRMTGEVLYAIGPRPAFMDSGSRILSHVRVMSNHTSKLNAEVQADVYSVVYDLMMRGKVTCIRPVSEGGIVQTLGEMALWGGMGAQIRPNLPVIELFSSAPGRFVVGILPQEAKAVEAHVRSEWLTPLGLTGGEKIMGLPIGRFVEERLGGGSNS